ncbi:MAG: carbon starvation protein A, partial [Acidobacteria bacterium]|nr:carbon starvation protein A [Acidobacteriota bacterium]
MNVLAVLIAAAAAFVLAGRFYSRFIARRLGEDPSRPTPAVALRDDRDFVPTKVPVVFAHHFSAIAG